MKFIQAGLQVSYIANHIDCDTYIYFDKDLHLQKHVVLFSVSFDYADVEDITFSEVVATTVYNKIMNELQESIDDKFVEIMAQYQHSDSV